MDNKTLILDIISKLLNVENNNKTYQENQAFLENLNNILTAYNNPEIAQDIAEQKTDESIVSLAPKNKEPYHIDNSTNVEPKIAQSPEEIHDEALDFSSFIYTKCEGYSSLFYNSEFKDMASKVRHMVRGELTYYPLRDIHRFKDKYIIILTTDELQEIYQVKNRKTPGQYIAFVVDKEQLPYLRISETSQLLLDDENHTNLCQEMVDLDNQHKIGYSDTELPNKVLIPFSDKKQEISSIDTDFANFIFERLTAYNQKCVDTYHSEQIDDLRFLSNGKSLNIQESIQLASILSETPYNFYLNSCASKSGLFISKNYHYNPQKCEYRLTTHSNKIGSGYCNPLIFDISNGFCTKENINTLRQYLMDVCSKRKERAHSEYDIKRTQELIDHINELLATLDTFEQRLENETVQEEDTTSLKTFARDSVKQGLGEMDCQLANNAENNRTPKTILPEQ